MIKKDRKIITIISIFHHLKYVYEFNLKKITKILKRKERANEKREEIYKIIIPTTFPFGKYEIV